MTAPAAVVRRPAYVLVPLAGGAVVAVLLGVYGKVHEPTGKAIFYRPFETMIGMKVWLTGIALTLAIAQLITALWMFGKLSRSAAPPSVGTVHKTLGTLAFLVTLPVALHCLYALGFESTDTRILMHSLLGCTFYGAFVAKVLTLHSKRVPGWALPWVGGLLFTALVCVALTSAVYWVVTRGVPG